MVNSKSRTADRYRALALAIGFVAAAAAGRAEVLINLQPVSAAAGSTGNTYDVTLKNTGPASVVIGGFSFGLSAGTSDITFTGVTTGTTTATYIFEGDSLFGPDISLDPAGQTMSAEDIFDTPGSGSTVGSGATVGLGLITFDVSAAASLGGIPVSFIPGDDSLSDEMGNPIAFSAEDSSITVTSGTTPTPEPATSGFVCMAFLGLAGVVRARRRTRG